jgi:hypothetical protein
MGKHALAVSTVLPLLAICATARAGEPSASPFFGLSAGVKGGIGGNYLSDPGDAPAYTAPFDGGAGGVGGGGGLALEFRALWGHLGLEFDTLFEGNKNWCNIEWTNNGFSLKTDWIYHYQTVRLPLLLEGSVENDLVRGSLGIGPEFVIGTKTSTDVVITEGSTPQTDELVAAWKDGFSAPAQTDTLLCIGIGLAFKIWKLNISLDVRYAYNAGQPKSFDDRERVNTSTDTGYEEVSAIASSTMDLRLLLGVAYEVGFGDF